MSIFLVSFRLHRRTKRRRQHDAHPNANAPRSVDRRQPLRPIVASAFGGRFPNDASVCRRLATTGRNGGHAFNHCAIRSRQALKRSQADKCRKATP